MTDPCDIPTMFQNVEPRLFIVPKEVAQTIPCIRISVNVHHATAQTRLQLGIMPPKQVHDASP